MRIFLALGAASLLAGGCLLVTSLEGLEGPPYVNSGGGGEGGAGGASVSQGGAGSGGDVLDAASEEAGPPGPILFRDRTAGGTPRGITLSPLGVYWTETKPAVGILYAPKEGKDVPIHVDANPDGLSEPFDVGVDDTNLYWTEYIAGTVKYKPLSAIGAPDSSVAADNYFVGAGRAAYLVMSAIGHMYVTDFNPSVAAVVEGRPGLSVANSQKPPATGIAYCGAPYWAWGQPSVIATPNPNSNVPSEFRVSAADVTITGLACDGTNLYWIENHRSIGWMDVVKRAPRDPLYTADADFEAGDAVGDIAVDGGNFIYFTEPLNRKIFKLAKPNVP